MGAASITPERNLLFGLLALQVGLINQGQLVAAFQAWTLDKARCLADHLVTRCDLDADQHAVLDAMVGLHLKKHGGSTEQSLAEIPVGRFVRECLASISDPQIEATLARFGSAALTSGDGDGDSTATCSVGSATSDGRRFHVLRPHAKGGLGAVFVALDAELNREVALKQILDSHADDVASRGRFMLEAEITGGLEHPGIVPVYGLGTYADGRPFYAMRFIRGETLKEAIGHFHDDDALKNDPGRRSLELRKLLRRFLDVCNAIGYAHSRGVLHRDIKPGNVIVGKHGETLVVDWGLAKATGKSDPSAGERTLLPSSADGSSETQPGSALGTPAYMSPEQTEGNLEALGPQSDVFSLGATLYCLLTGGPPVEGDDIGAVLRAVQRGEFAPPRRIDPTIDMALEAVCMKAMALKPADRYETPKALAEDVERWMAEERVTAWSEPWSRRARRWGRRNRTAVAAAAATVLVALAGTAAVLAVQTRANLELKAANDDLAAANTQVKRSNANLEAANQRERLQFELAMSAIKLFHGEVSEDLLMKEKQFEGLRTKLLRGAADFYGKLEALLKGQTDRASRAALGRAYDELGELTDEIGSKPEALAVHRKALAVRRELADALDSDATTQADVARSLLVVGSLQDRTGDTSGALASFEEARRLAEVLTASERAGDSLQAVLGLAQHRIGQLFQDTGKPAAALASFERGIAIWRKLADARPDVTQFQSDLGTGYADIGVLLYQTGEPTKALNAHERALAIRQKLTDANPSITRFQNELASSHLAIGYDLLHAGNSAKALAAFKRALAIQQQLADANPNVTDFQSRLSAIHTNMGWALSRTGKPAEALAAVERAIAITQKLADADPNVTDWQRLLAVNIAFVSEMQVKAGRTAEAVASVRRAIAILKRPSFGTPRDLYNLACGHAQLAGFAAEPGSGMTAAEGWAEADQAMESLRRAVVAGYRKFTLMRTDLDLDPLRSRPDFQLLMMDLEFPADPFAQ